MEVHILTRSKSISEPLSKGKSLKEDDFEINLFFI